MAVVEQDVLVLGGSHFIGRAIVRRFQSLGCSVTVLNRGSRRLEGVQQLVADRDDEAAVRAVLSSKKYSVVVDCSGLTKNRVAYAVDALSDRADQWIHISSAAVYAPATTLPIHETHPSTAHPVWGQYGRDKAECDAWLLSSGVADRLTILRPPYVFGANNSDDREQFIWRRLLAKRTVAIPGSGETVIQFVHVDDLAQVVCLAAENTVAGLRIYNAGSPSAFTMNGWVQLLAEVAQVEAHVVHVPHGALDTRPRDFFPFRDLSMFLDARSAIHDLAWQPRDPRECFVQTFEQAPPHPLQSAETLVEDRILRALQHDIG